MTSRSAEDLDLRLMRLVTTQAITRGLFSLRIDRRFNSSFPPMIAFKPSSRRHSCRGHRPITSLSQLNAAVLHPLILRGLSRRRPHIAVKDTQLLYMYRMGPTSCHSLIAVFGKVACFRWYVM